MHIPEHRHTKLVFILLEHLDIEARSDLPYEIMRVEQFRGLLRQLGKVPGVTGGDDVTVVSAVDRVEPQALEQTIPVTRVNPVHSVVQTVGQTVAVLVLDLT